MRVTPVVMAHVARGDHAVELVEELGGPDRCDVALDRGTPSADPEKRWANGRVAWSLAATNDSSATHGLVVQDDAILAPDFLAGVEKALEHVPDAVPVSFYMGDRPVRPEVEHHLALADQHRISWAIMARLYWGVAFAVPVDHVRRMLAYGDDRRGLPYDMRVGEFYALVVKRPCWYTVPSLADHRQGPSLVGHHVPRRAARFAQQSATEIDWSRTPRWDVR